MSGSVVLCGGKEFEPDSLPVSRAILHLVQRTPPRITIIPVAADNPRRAVKTGMGHFKSLNVTAESVMAADAETVNDGSISTLIETTDVTYLTDSNPEAAVTVLRDSDLLAKLVHFWQQGMVLALSGASAMALCDVYWDSGNWEPGLGVLKGIAVIPHYEFVAGRFSGKQIRANLPAEYTLIGIGDSTGVVIAGQDGRVVGEEMVTVTTTESEKEYTDGTRFKLAMPLG